MALDMAEVEGQVACLGRQRAELIDLSQRLSACRYVLDTGWPSRESAGLRQTLPVLSRRCSRLEERLAALQRDVLRAAAELQAEEAEE